jgi:putative hemolysin
MNMIFERMLGIFMLLIASAFFAGSETALFSLSRIARHSLQSMNTPAAKRVLALLSNPRRLIVTLIVCNEVVNIAASSIAATVTSDLLPNSHELARVVITTAVIVPLILMFGEMAPKSLAVRLGERWAMVIARPLSWFATLIAPLRMVLYGISGAIVFLLGGKRVQVEMAIKEDEFRALVDLGSEAGELEIAERRLIHKVFEFGDTTVGKVMTASDKVFALPYEMPLRRLAQAVAEQKFSRVPIYRSGARRTGSGATKRAEPPEIVGIIHAKDLVGYAHGLLEGHTLSELLHPPLFVPRTTKCDRLFREFQRRKTHIALVVDEYGKLLGLVTMEDLLEELFGEIVDEKEVRA